MNIRRCFICVPIAGLALAIAACGCEDSYDLLWVNPAGQKASIVVAGSTELVCVVPAHGAYLKRGAVTENFIAGPYSVVVDGHVVQTFDWKKGDFAHGFRYKDRLIILTLRGEKP